METQAKQSLGTEKGLSIGDFFGSKLHKSKDSKSPVDAEHPGKEGNSTHSEAQTVPRKSGRSRKSQPSKTPPASAKAQSSPDSASAAQEGKGRLSRLWGNLFKVVETGQALSSTGQGAGQTARASSKPASDAADKSAGHAPGKKPSREKDSAVEPTILKEANTKSVAEKRAAEGGPSRDTTKEVSKERTTRKKRLSREPSSPRSRMLLDKARSRPPFKFVAGAIRPARPVRNPRGMSGDASEGEKPSSTSKKATKDISRKKATPVSDTTKSLKSALVGTSIERAIAQTDKKKESARSRTFKASAIETVEPAQLELTALPIEQPPVPRLSHNLDRVLFNQGVYQLQDPRSRVYNFDPYLEEIMPVHEFDFNALKEYKTSSKDETLSSIAQEYGKKYVGSTSSMTAVLAHFHYLLSQWRPLDVSMLSRGFPDADKSAKFTELNRAPSSIFLRWKDGTYAIDADKEHDSANVLMLLGKSMEKLLTMDTSDFERYRKSDPRGVTQEEREDPESYHYSTQGDFLMRSQLDAHDPRLPGTGMFDLKTRAVVSIRMRSSDYEDMSGYEIQHQHGHFESYEREYYDMMRSTLLKYSLQARMGRMDGIFVAYHNVKRIFGFQYLSINEIDRALHGQLDRCLGDQEFLASIELLNKALDAATKRFPEQVSDGECH